jgi:hypothetical protein
MDKLEERIAAIFGGGEKTRPFFDVIAPILTENENQEPHMRGATLATVDVLRTIVRELQKFDVGQDWVQESKLRRNRDLLQAALYSAFLVGSMTAAVPTAQDFRLRVLNGRAVKARAAKRPGQVVVGDIVQDELIKFRASRPSSKLRANAIAGRIMEAVNQRLAESKRLGQGLTGELSQGAIAKRIIGLKISDGCEASD